MPKNLLYYTQFKDNNFDFLRLLAALLVLFSHSYPLTGHNATEWFAVKTHGFLTFGALAVSCFFIISGFLITASMLNRGAIIDYFVARILRIYPALIIAVLICALVIGPLVTTFSLEAYFTNGLVYTFIKHNSLLWEITYFLPGAFTTNVYPNAVNGSLWTLPIEFSLYIIVGILGLMRFLTQRVMASFIIILLLIIPFLLQIKLNLFADSIVLSTGVQPYYCFALGMLFYLWRDKIFLHGGILTALIISAWFIKSPLFFFIVFAYFIFYIAYHRKIKLNKLTQWGDFSYGVYIYAFPVQQVMMHYFNFSEVYQLFLAALLPTLSLAILSWHVIEHPALNLKTKLNLSLRFNRYTARTTLNLTRGQ